MIFKIVPDENAQEVAFVNGEVDFLEISTYDALQKYEADDTVTVIQIIRKAVSTTWRSMPSSQI